MMRLIDLSQQTVFDLCFALYLICLGAAFCAVRAFPSPATRRQFRLCLFITPPNYIVASAVLLYTQTRFNERQVSAYLTRMMTLPVWAVCLLAVVSCAAVVVMFIQTERIIGSELSARSICEGLDQLPNGVCCSTEDGFPELVNNKMQEISNVTFGVGVQNTHLQQERLKSGDLQPGCRMEDHDENRFLLLPDGTAWLLQQTPITVGAHTMTETIAYDVTQRYNSLKELEVRNARLEAVNARLHDYLNDMNRMVREQEVLTAKIRLHADLGQSLLAIRSYLTDSDSNRESVVEQLTKPVSLLQSDVLDEHSEDRFYALQEAAKAVGIAITMQGRIPPVYSDLLAVAIHECLTNTVKHAAGHRLDVIITEADDDYTVTLQNDGKPPVGAIEETGGLGNLRTLTEKQNGTMKIVSAPVFRLTLRLPKPELQPPENKDKKEKETHG